MVHFPTAKPQICNYTIDENPFLLFKMIKLFEIRLTANSDWSFFKFCHIN